MKHLLIIYHSQSGKTARMADSVLAGATHPDIEGVQVRLGKALESGVEDLLWANALVLGTPENFGYMSGGMKDFLDRTFYPCEGKLEGLGFAMFVGAGNDGTNALSSMRRIANGYNFKEVREPVIARGDLTAEHLQQCHNLGMSMAAGLELGLF